MKMKVGWLEGEKGRGVVVVGGLYKKPAGLKISRMMSAVTLHSPL